MTHDRSDSEKAGHTDPPSVKSKTLQIVLVSLGVGFVALGVLGIFLPVMPTTVFLLLAAACFVRSSERLHNWLQNHRVLGVYLQAVQGRSGMPRRAKITTLAVLWVSILCSAFIFINALWLQISLLAIACGVSIFILRIKTLEIATVPKPVDAGNPEKPDQQRLGTCREAECT